HGLGAVPLRPLGLGGAVGLDVDRRRAVGLRAVSLRPLGVRGRRLGLGAGPRGHPAGYAPALVVFVGGHNWSVAIGAGGGGGVAWFPLAPEEPYVPAYHVSNTYIRNVNVTNVNVTNINVTNVNVTNLNYRNRGAPDAVRSEEHTS